MTIDANIVIAYLAGEQSVTQTIISWRTQNTPLFLSSVAESEVLSFSKWTDEELLLTEQFLQENFTTIPFDRTLARFAAEIRRTTRMKFPDAAIAATAVFTHSAVVTRNVRDFKRIQGLQVITI